MTSLARIVGIPVLHGTGAMFPSGASQHLARFVEFKTRVPGKVLGGVAVTKIAEEVHFPFAVRAKLRIHFRRVETRHWATIESDQSGSKYEIASSERAVTECGFIDYTLIPYEVRAHVGVRK
jgi:hypothetical protein